MRQSNVLNDLWGCFSLVTHYSWGCFSLITHHSWGSFRLNLHFINGSIAPIEVKAGKSGTLKSLHQFIKNKNCATAYRFDLNPPSSQSIECAVTNGDPKSSDIKFELLSLPIYMIQHFIQENRARNAR